MPNLAPLLGTPDLGTFFTFLSILGARFGSIFGPQKWVPKNGPLLKI